MPIGLPENDTQNLLYFTVSPTAIYRKAAGSIPDGVIGIFH